MRAESLDHTITETLTNTQVHMTETVLAAATELVLQQKFNVTLVLIRCIQAENVFAALQDVVLLDLLVFYKQELNVCTLAKVQRWSWPEGLILRCLREILWLKLVAELYVRSIHCLMFHETESTVADLNIHIVSVFSYLLKLTYT